MEDLLEGEKTSGVTIFSFGDDEDFSLCKCALKGPDPKLSKVCSVPLMVACIKHQLCENLIQESLHTF